MAVYGKKFLRAKIVIDDTITEGVTDFHLPRKHDFRIQNKYHRKNTPV